LKEQQPFRGEKIDILYLNLICYVVNKAFFEKIARFLIPGIFFDDIINLFR
jgi:hypothetical protein